MDKAYIEVVRILLESAPAIFQTPHFAMKGGSAINLFVDDMPRLSVDIDVVFTDHTATREAALKSISSGLAAVQGRLSKTGLESDVSVTKDGDEIKLFVRRGGKLPGALTPNQRRFLIGLVECEPDWKLMSCPHLAMLPAIRWKLQNLAKLKTTNPRKFAQQAHELREKLAG